MSSRGGFWAITKRLFQERQLLSFSIADWARSRTSSNYLASAYFIELLYGATMGMYAFGDVDDGD